MKNTPFIAVTSQPVPYHADTTAIFNTLCQQNSNSLLLDSAEIGSKNSLQSLILINAAVKITCLGNQVTFRALNANGKQVLKEIHPVLGQLGTVSAVNFDDEFSETDCIPFIAPGIIVIKAPTISIKNRNAPPNKTRNLIFFSFFNFSVSSSIFSPSLNYYKLR